MDENLRTQPNDGDVDEAWQTEIRRAQIELAQKNVAPPVVDERKSLIKLLAKGVLVGFLTLFLLFAWVYADNALLPFDSVAWKANVGREKQIGRLRRQVQLAGMTRQNVLQKLGNPDEQSETRLLYAWSTYMGVGFLVLELKQNRVVRQRIAKD